MYLNRSAAFINVIIAQQHSNANNFEILLFDAQDQRMQFADPAQYLEHGNGAAFVSEGGPYNPIHDSTVGADYSATDADQPVASMHMLEAGQCHVAHEGVSAQGVPLMWGPTHIDI